jgi:hypothetical protein
MKVYSNHSINDIACAEIEIFVWLMPMYLTDKVFRY